MNSLTPAYDFLIRLSQSHLTLLETCPPQFQKVFLEQMGSPPNPQQQDALAWGNRFHLLMQQKALGLPWGVIADPQFERSLEKLIEASSELWKAHSPLWKEAEHTRTLAIQNYLLSVIYDLLVINEAGAQILDWKTYAMPQNLDKVVSNWQTRLYLYVLAETSPFVPEQLSMTYWFVQSPEQVQRLTIPYSPSQHQQTHLDLMRLLSQLETWRTEYLQSAIAFPHRPDCAVTCPYFASLVSRSHPQNPPYDWQKFLAETPEIPFNNG
jgi:hypothetical protein